MKKQPLKPLSVNFHSMGSNCFIKIFTDDLTHGRKTLELAMNEVKRLNDKYSRYHPDSLVSHINAAAGTNKLITLDEEARGLINYADICHQQSDGLFDITSGALRKAWNFKNPVDTIKLPTQQTLKSLSELVGWHKVKREEDGFNLPILGMEIDFGGIVKEYAADAVATLCTSRGVQRGLVNLAGDLKIIGPPSKKNQWNVLIQKPNVKDEYLATCPLSKGAAATSGTYERTININNKQYSHLLNPKTGWPIESNIVSVTVFAPDCVVAGSLSTIAMLKGVAGAAWLKEHIETPYLCCLDDGSIESNITEKNAL